MEIDRRGFIGGLAATTVGGLMPEALGASVPDESFIPSPIDDLRVGQRVEHNRFGFGNIRQLSNVQKPDDAKTVISFDDFGEKILLLKYAKLRIIE